MKYVSQEFYEMLHSLQEGLAVFKNKQISFSNKTFQKIVDRINFGDEINMKDYKLFKLYRNNDD